MGWKIVVATLAALIALDFVLPPFEAGPANTGRFVFGLWLVAFLVLTLLAWIARGRWRSVVVWTIAALIWLWFAYVLVALFLWPEPDNNSVLTTLGIEVVLALTAAAITTIGIQFWRMRSMGGVARWQFR